MSSLTSQAKRLIQLTTPLGDGAVLATGFTGREELSRPFRFNLEMVSDNAAIAATDLVGNAVGWKVAYPVAGPRPFHGIVRSLAAGPFIGRKLRSYRAEVVPSLWLLTRTADCKIYQKKTALEIVKAVLGQFSVTFADSTTKTYPAHEYRVQYRETAFAFVSRLMEEEGISYFFRFADGSHTMVLADDASAYQACAPHGQPEYRPQAPDAEAISEWERRFEYVSGKATLTDYNFTTPATSLLSNTPTTLGLQGIAGYEVFDYPGRFLVGGDGASLSKVRMEELEAPYDTVVGAGRCSSFAAGCTFAPKNHPADTATFALVSVEHSASEPWVAGTVGGGVAEYRNRFACMPVAVPFRAARATPRPLVPGPQPAVVVGPSGEEIYTDKYGRIKVQFFWDRYGTGDENSSCFIRVAEMWAGQQWGMVFTPRIGQEVLVDFLEGDPDQPVVTGRVYNAAQMPPYALPDNMTQSGLKTRSTKGGGADTFNELRFEDKKDSEDIYFHAQKDFHRFVEHDDDLQVLGNQTIAVTGNRTEEVKEGNESITITKGDRAEEVKAGNETVKVTKGNRTITVSEGDDSHEVSKGNRTVKVKADDTLTVDSGNVTVTVSQGKRAVAVSQGDDSLTVDLGSITIKASAGAITIDGMQGITLKCGSNSIKIAPDGITIAGMMVTAKGDVQTKIGGAIIQVSADAMLQLKGGVTMIG